MVSSLDKSKVDNKNMDNMIKEHLPFIISTISSVTGRYISLENDEELSIGLMAFAEAMDKYDEERGSFLSFAKLVIESRIKNYLAKENKYQDTISLDKLVEQGFDVPDIIENPIEDKSILRTEIYRFKEDLKDFGITMELLVDSAPKHKDTRKRAVEVSEKVSEDADLTSFIFEKKRLPIKKISLKYLVTEKILKRSKFFILSVIIIFFRKYRNLILWIKN
ncbi:sigma factor [Clostridium polynesiense]|uniref:sigma factor n=1 Tax=Clostridium polynesiense TaxID=1325933 RepID=UPI00058F4827|nr:sigma factor [Clostridium polynesiense]